MDTKMSQKTRSEVLAKQRARYARAGKEHKTKIINELVELFDYHRKAAIRALQPRRVLGVPFVIGRPKEYDPDKLRALPNRSEAATLLQIRDVEEHLPFPLCGLDSDNGGRVHQPLSGQTSTRAEEARGLHTVAPVSQERPTTFCRPLNWRAYRFHLPMDTLAVRLAVPLAGPALDLNPNSEMEMRGVRSCSQCALPGAHCKMSHAHSVHGSFV